MWGRGLYFADRAIYSDAFSGGNAARRSGNSSRGTR
jgi:hypothetical protein